MQLNGGALSLDARRKFSRALRIDSTLASSCNHLSTRSLFVFPVKLRNALVALILILILPIAAEVVSQKDDSGYPIMLNNFS